MNFLLTLRGLFFVLTSLFGLDRVYILMYIINMQYITTTELRTKSRKLVEILREGRFVDLIHRSRVVGEIRPKIYDPKPFDPDKVAKIARKLNLPELSYREREKRYRAHLMKKYGEGLS